MALEGIQLGHYRLVRLIGSGGMGEVYFAEDVRIARKVAIKVVRNEADPYPNSTTSREAVRLFEREMKAITTLDHPNILPLIDFGEETINKAALTYMVMPFRPEGSLVDWLQKEHNADALSPQEASHIVLQAASALQHAHNHQLMHLDVKPSNFLIRRREDQPHFPDILLSDFGIAKFNSATATASQSIRGTPAYMAPEQWAGSPVAATDQYALAIMAYQMLTQRTPFRGNMQQVMYQHLQAQPQPPSTFNSSIPTAIDAVILRALAKKPEDRFPSIQAFATAFEQGWRGEVAPTPPPSMQPAFPGPFYTPISDAPLPPTQQAIPTSFYSSASAAPPPLAQYMPPAQTPAPEKAGRSRLPIVLGLIALVVLGSIAFALFGHSPPTYPQLNPSYSGTYNETSPRTTSNQMSLRIDSQDQQGNITATLNFNNGKAIYSCRGSVTLDKHIALQCSGYLDFTVDLQGTIYPDGHIAGTSRATRTSVPTNPESGTWSVS